MPNMMVLGSEAFIRYLGHKGGALKSGISVLKITKQNKPESSLTPQNM